MTDETRTLARYMAEATAADLPEAIRAEGPRAFSNWLGCLYGGLHTETNDIAYGALSPMAGAGGATVIGRGRKADPVSATFFNTLSSCTQAFDDTHLATITHPTGPAAAAALAEAELQGASGEAMLTAMLLGIEAQCRLAAAIFVPPASSSLALYMTGLTGAVGAAVAAGRLKGLDAVRMTHAIGIASAAGAGFRETHATMSNGLMRAQAARNGMTAACLAEAGFTCAPTAIEGPKGFIASFATKGNPAALTHGLGQRFEISDLTYKPYPCAIVIHPIIDACRALRDQIGEAEIASIAVEASPRAMSLAGRKEPKDAEDARVSLYHWAAAILLHGYVGTSLAQDAAVVAADTVRMRSRVSARLDESLSSEAARVSVTLADGRRFSSVIDAALGSRLKPLPDSDLRAKFVDQVGAVAGAEGAAQMWNACIALPAKMRICTDDFSPS